MEIRELFLDTSKKTTVHGDLYGLDYSVRNERYWVKYYLDIYNRRVKVIDFQVEDTAAMVRLLDYLARQNQFDKVFLKARSDEWEKLLPYGFVLEGIFKYFFNGEHAYCLSKFYSQERRVSLNFDEATEILETVSQLQSEPSPQGLPTGYQLREAGEDDIQEISALYDRVFKTYPIPLNRPQYVENLMDEDYLFMVITHQGKIISSASADINYNLSNAEITDCASLPDHRGKGLMLNLIAGMEGETRDRGIRCLFSIARALSPGMNTVFRKMDYTYSGRLVNSCNIFGKFEDMNLWVKSTS